MRDFYHIKARYPSGPDAAGATVTIYTDAAHTTLATVYAASSGGSPISGSVVTTDAMGVADFYYAVPAILHLAVAGEADQPIAPFAALPPTGTGFYHATAGVRDAVAVGAMRVFDASDYGAGGTSDDTAALQACIDASTSCSAIYLPPGVYTISAPLSIPQYRTIFGPHADEYASTVAVIRLKSGNSSATAMLASAQWLGSGTSCGNSVTIKDLVVDGNKANCSSGVCDGIVMMNQKLILENVKVFGCTGNGIHLTDRNHLGAGHELTTTENECRLYRCHAWQNLLSGIQCDNFSPLESSKTASSVHCSSSLGHRWAWTMRPSTD